MAARGASSEYPKVLIAGNQVPHLKTPSAILLFRLFQHWPADRLLALGPEYHPEAERLACRYVEWKPRWQRLENTRFHRTVRSLRTAGILPLDQPEQLAALLGGFQPDVVVSLMEFQQYYAAALGLARFLRKPYVLMVHDVPELFERHSRLVDGLHDRTAGRTYRAAQECLPISKPMEAELFRRWRRHGVVLPPIPSDDPSTKATTIRPPGATFTVGYAGSLDSRYGPLLHSFARAIEGSDLRLHVYSGKAPEWPGTGGNTEYRGYYPPTTLWDLVVAECDAVLLPYQANDEHDRLMIEFSFPSKLPEYLRLGLPVILAVPERSAAAAWASEHPEALIITRNEPGAIVTACRQLQANHAARQQLGNAAKQLYHATFNPDEMRERFRQLIVRVANDAAR